MKVRILSGNQKGAVVEMPRLEAEASISTGYAEEVKDEPKGKAKKAEPEPERPVRATPETVRANRAKASVRHK